MSGEKSDILSDETKPLTRLIVSRPNSKIEDDPNSLDSVIRWDTIEMSYFSASRDVLLSHYR